MAVIAHGLLASVMTAALHWFALPPRGIPILGVVSFAPILAYVWSVPRLWMAITWAVAAYGLTVLVNCAWLVSTLSTFLSFGTMEGTAVLVGFSLLEGGRFGVSVGLALFVTRWRRSPCGPAREIMALASAMVIVDVLYPQLFPWPLGVPLIDALPFVQAVAIAGPSALTLFVALGSGALAVLLRRGENGRLGAAVAGGFVALSFLLGALRLHLASAQKTMEGPVLRVGLIQGGTPPLEKRTNPRVVLERHAALTQNLLRRESEVDLVVWSETAAAQLVDARHWPDVLRKRVGFVASSPILTGVTLASVDADGSSIKHNSAVILSPNRVTCDRCRYDKQRLVPYAETRRLLGLPFDHLFSRGGRLDTSEMNQPLELAGVRLATFICYESLDAELVRRLSRGSPPADVLVNITNDGWFGESSARALHFALGKLRAVEQGRYLVRVAETGFSGVVDPLGRVISGVEPNVSASLTAVVPLVKRVTPFAIAGSAPATACAFGVLAFLLLRHRYGTS